MVLILVAGSTLSAPTTGASAIAADEPCVGADCDVVADPEDAQYVGTGGLLLPGDSFTGSSDDREAAAICAECRWAFLPMCREGSDVACGPAADSCPPGQFRRIVLLLRPNATEWEEIGLVCLRASGPTTVADVADRLHNVVIEKVPPLRPSSQPLGGTLVQLPAIFDSGQPAHLGDREFDLVGFHVVLQGRATWLWRFGDGSEVTTSEPGGGWPDDSVSHTYRKAGEYSVTVATEWRAWFTVDGLGPFEVGGDPVVQVASPFGIPVQQARAQLVVD
jgi:hypothetical protein